MDLHEYIRDARAGADVKSDRELSRKLAGNPNLIQNYTRGAAWPSDDIMLKLAEMGGHDPAIALLDLNRWRAGARAASIYSEILSKIAGTAAAILVAITALSLNNAPALAAMSPADQKGGNQHAVTALAARERQQTNAHPIYIMRQILMAGYHGRLVVSGRE